MNNPQGHRLQTRIALFGYAIEGAPSVPSACLSVRDDRHMRPVF